MIRRAFLFLLALALLVPAASRADDIDFSFTPDNGGAAYNFTFDSAPVSVFDNGYVQYATFASLDGNYGLLLASDSLTQYLVSQGWGNVDAAITDASGQFLAFITGDQLYTGDVYSPVMRFGTYAIAASPLGSSGTMSLAAAAPAALPVAATPEPSSLALLGTGILGVAGTLRRRFMTA